MNRCVERLGPGIQVGSLPQFAFLYERSGFVQRHFARRRPSFPTVCRDSRILPKTCSAEVARAVPRHSARPSGRRDAGATVTGTAVPTKNLAVYGRGTNCTHAGEVIWSTCPVGVRRPVLGWMRKTTTLSDCWFAANNQEPVGSTAKLRGVFPSVETTSTLVRVPFIGSIEKTAMLSCPRFEAYRKLPEGCSAISDAKLGSENRSGSVEIVLSSRKPPVAGS